MSTTIAAIILAVIVIIGGVGAYAALSSVPASKSTTSSCSPSYVCAGQGSGGTNDVQLFIPYTVGFGQVYSQIAVGTTVQATVSVTGSETISTFGVQWAPGVTSSGSSGTLTYTYPVTSVGLYPIVPNATAANGVVHTGLGELAALKVNQNSLQITSGKFPTLSTTLTNGTGGYYPWIGAGGSVTVSGSYAAAPSNLTYSPAAPTLTSTGGTQSNLASTAKSVTATYTFANAGYYGITMVVPVSSPSAGTSYGNFTWGVFVAPSAAGLGCALCKIPTASSPHSNTFVNYEVIPGGAETLDPAFDYYSVGYEVGEAFDESLIALNGTDSGSTYQNFVPEVATCVPGSPLCTSLYGSTLVQGNNFTFAIDPAAHFYDPTTGASRMVYPSDVMFSIIRALFGTQIYGTTGEYVGFDIAGPLIPYQVLSPNEVNASWDPGPAGIALHAPYNNTPMYAYDSMAVNDSAYCPAKALAANGCITFHADADNEAWPALLLILSIVSADGIQPAGWYTAQGANVPGFVCTSDPDSPCLLPGGATSTNSTAFKDAVAAMPDTAFDADEAQAATGVPDPFPSVGFNEVGSGPYYLAYANPGVGYVLKANPAYQAPTGCAGQVGCLPLPGAYVANVIDYWEATDTVGISEVEAGYADTAAFESTDFSTMLSLVANGQLGLLNFPTLDTDNYGWNTQIDIALLKTIDSGVTINIPDNAFSYIGLRALLEYAYPYTTAQSLGNLIDGIDGGNPFGGFLPAAESSYYNPNTPWPNYDNTTQTFSNPTFGSATTPGTASYYWTQATTASSPYYDPQLASFSSSNPLLIPVVGFTSAPNINAVEVAWGNSLKTLTNGVVQFQQYFVPSTTAIYSYLTPGEVPWAVWWFGWIPDYPAPVNNWEGAYGTGLWGGADALFQTFNGVYGGNYNDSSCGHSAFTMADLTYWAEGAGAGGAAIIPQICQGTAWNVTVWAVGQATYTSNFAYSQTLWYLVQDVYNNLQLTIGNEESNVIFDYAPWVNPATINTNVLIGGGAEWYYQSLGGNGLY